MTILVLGAAVFLRFELGSHLPRALMPHWSEDFVHVRQAEALLAGDWLGDYDFRLLRRPPGYSFYLAGLARLGLTERSGSMALHAIACLVFFHSLRRLGTARSLAAAAFLLLLFSPAMHGAVAASLAEQRLLATLSVLFTALSLRLLARDTPAGFGVTVAALAVVWAMIEVSGLENGRLAAPLVVALGTRLALARGEGRVVPTTASVILVAAVTFAAGTMTEAWVESRNLDRYGVATLSELEEEGFLAAVTAVRRVSATETSADGSMSAELRRRIYEASPLFARLEDGLESESFSGPAGREDGSGRPAALFRLALREAANRAGVHRSARDASDYYHALAAEIDRLCEEDVLPSTARPLASDRPGFTLERAGRALGATWHRLQELWRFTFEDVRQADPLATVKANGPRVAAYERILGERAGLMADRPYRDAARRREVTRLVRAALPALAFAAGIALITQLALLRERRLDRGLAAELVLFGTVCTTTFTVVFDEIDWIVNRGRDLLPAYLHMGAWAVVSLGAFGRFGRRPDSPARLDRIALAALAAAIVVSVVVIDLRAARAESPLIDSEGTGLEDFWLFGDGAGLARRDDEILVSFDDVDRRLEIRPRIVEESGPVALVLSAAAVESPERASFEVSWTGNRRDDLGRTERQLFIRRDGPDRWTIPLGRGRLEAVSLVTRDSPGLRLRLDAIRLVELESHAVAPFPLPTVEGRASEDGRLTVSVRGGERESRYEFYVAGGIDDEPRRYPERTGGMWLADDSAIRDAEGEALCFDVFTDAEGNGKKEVGLPISAAEHDRLWIQGVGTTHFTEHVTVTR